MLRLRISASAALLLTSYALQGCSAADVIRNRITERSNERPSEPSKLAENVTISATTHVCHTLPDFELCVPHPGRDRAILARSQLDLARLKSAVEKFSGTSDTTNVPVPLGSDTYDVTALFPTFIATRFNTLANFSGPNCYNTALLASGGLDAADIRYISLEEFDQIIGQQYEQVPADQARFGDILVYDANGSREHAALYLGSGLIFHKKGVMKGYGYRITGIDTAYDYEPGEWTESPLRLALLPADAAVISAPRAFYRHKKTNSRLPDSSPVTQFVELMRSTLQESAPHWRVHKDFGIISENVMTQLRKYLESNPIADQGLHQLIMARLISLRDQIYLSIDQTLFQTPRGTTRRDELMREFCYADDNAFFKQIITGIATIVRPGLVPTETEISQIQLDIRAFDRGTCNIPLVDIVQKNLVK